MKSLKEKLNHLGERVRNYTFKFVVAAHVSRKGNKELARLCQVIPSTVNRWAKGTAIPGRHVQRFVLKRIYSLWV